MTADDIALTLQRGLGVRGAVHLLAAAGSAAAVYAASEAELVGAFGLRADIAHGIAAKSAHRQAEAELKYMRRHGISAVASTDAAYPALLRECPDYPHVLYFTGDAAAFGGRPLAMVGTRAATPYGRHMCDVLAGRLAEMEPDVSLVSGLAYGIDAEVHRAALRYGLRTVAVIAAPLPDVTPAQHRQLARDIVEHGGAVATELHSATRRNGAYFIPRNRIIAGMAEGTVVVESPAAGGALSTASLADGYGRAVMAVPGRVGDRCSAGANRLIAERRAALVCSGDDIVRELGWDIAVPGVIPRSTPPPPVLGADERLVMECLADGSAVDMDTLSLRSGIPVGQLSAVLLGLELAGLVRSLPGKRYEKN